MASIRTGQVRLTEHMHGAMDSLSPGTWITRDLRPWNQHNCGKLKSLDVRIQHYQIIGEYVLQEMGVGPAP